MPGWVKISPLENTKIAKMQFPPFIWANIQNLTCYGVLLSESKAAQMGLLERLNSGSNKGWQTPPPHPPNPSQCIFLGFSDSYQDLRNHTESWRTNKASYQLKYWPRRPPEIFVTFEVILTSKLILYLGVHQNTRVHTVKVIVQRTRNVRGMVIMSVGRPA